MSEIKYYLKGYNGQIFAYEDRIVITRKGFLGFASHGLAGEKVIPLSSIQSVQFQETKGFANGYIQFSVMGGVERRGGLSNAASDENSVIFTIDNEDDARKIKKYVESSILSRNQPVVPQIVSQSAVSVADELLKFKQLLDMGVITQEEFETQKKKLLNS